jgi:hypothetical protein
MAFSGFFFVYFLRHTSTIHAEAFVCAWVIGFGGLLRTNSHLLEAEEKRAGRERRERTSRQPHHLARLHRTTAVFILCL